MCQCLGVGVGVLMLFPHLVSGVGEGLTHSELIVLVLLVEAEGEAQHVGVIVGGRPVVKHYFNFYSFSYSLINKFTCGKTRDCWASAATEA